MILGAFSISLSVQDIDASKAFYEALGFTATDGDGSEWLILRNGESTIGLFHGLFDANILTFNPRLRGSDMSPMPEWPDVREIQQSLLDAGVELTGTVATDEGAGHLTLVDPDGNAILIDQF